MGFVDEGFSRVKIAEGQVFLSAYEVLSKTSDLKRALNLLIKSLVETIEPADAGILYLYDDKLQQLGAKVSHGYNRDNAEHSLCLNEGAARRCYGLRKSLLLSSVEAMMEYTATLRPENANHSIKMRQGLRPTLSMIATPLILREKSFGVVLLKHYKQHRPFRETDLPQVEALASWISLILDDMQSYLEVKHTKRSYRELLGKLNAATEEERRRIAREIHDEVDQLLLSVKFNFENMEILLPDDFIEVRNILEVSKSSINRALDELDKLILNLRPPALDDLGLPQALDWYIHNFSKEAHLPITLEMNNLTQRRPAPVIETQLFRIAQEALSNVAKHAQATSAKVKLNFSKLQLVLEVEDNGVGFDHAAVLHMSSDKRSLGLLGMKERAELCGGTLQIDSAPEHGTCIRVYVLTDSYDWGAY